jgi:branched-chain amino acid transport system substrate-binding protein
LAGRGGEASGIDPKTHHMAQPVLIAQVQNGAFAVLADHGMRMGDPYLTGPASPVTRTPLRVVS